MELLVFYFRIASIAAFAFDESLLPVIENAIES
jgi:hypothetical protein